MNNIIDYTVNPNEITNAGIQKPSNTIIDFLIQYPWLGKNIQTLIGNTNQPMVSNIMAGLGKFPNKLAKILDTSNLEQLSKIINTTHTSFIIKHFIANSTDNIIKAISLGEINIFFTKTRAFFKNTINSILNKSDTTIETQNETIMEENNINQNQPIITNYTILNFQNKFKGLEEKIQFLIQNSSEDKVSELISGLTYTPVRLANIIRQSNLVNFSNILKNNDDLSVIIKNIQGNSTEDIIYAIKYGKMPGIITKAKSFFKNKILSFLGTPNNNEVKI